MVSKEKLSDKRTNMLLVGAALGLASTLVAGTALAELKVTGAGKEARMAPDQFPAEHQERLKLFEAKCGKCHDLDRPITAIKTGKTPISSSAFDDDGIKGYVTKMMRKPNSGVEQSDAKEIIILLRFARTLAGG
jgi:hypothetical protein